MHPMMNPTEETQANELHTAVHVYLSAFQAIGDCLAQTCPQIGGLYRHRLSRLRARLAFDSSAPALQESLVSVEAELSEYATKASGYVAQHGIELRSAIAALEEIVKTLVQRQDFYGARLRQFATQMEATAYPTEAVPLQEVIALQVAGLLSCVESMNHETQSLVARMQNELAAAENRLRDAEVTDSLTGLMNRREMERQINARVGAGEPVVLLQFDLSGDTGNEVVRQVAARLGSQFRYKDLVSRWSKNKFLVLFQGPADIAQSRAEQIVPWVAGRYLLDNGDTAQVSVEFHLTQPELVG